MEKGYPQKRGTMSTAKSQVIQSTEFGTEITRTCAKNAQW